MKRIILGMGLITFFLLSGNLMAAKIKTSSSSVLENRARYSHKNVVDGDIYTAWAEGAEGNGKGEWIKLEFERERKLHHLGIIPGYFKYNDNVGEVWFKNNRIKEATLIFSDSSTKKIDLVDMKQMQFVTIDKKTRYVKLRIDDVYPGSKWEDACISEIKPIFSDFKDMKASLKYGYHELPKNENEFYALLDIQTAYYKTKRTTPLEIAVVIDRSGSMSSKDKLGYVKKAVKNLYNSLSTDDKISVISYSNRSTVDLDSKALDKISQSDFNSIIGSIDDGGGTNLYSGMEKGLKILEKSSSGRKKRLILLSDGLANKGITDSKKIAARAEKAMLNNKITTSTFGVGSDYNEELLAQIADATMGDYFYIANPREAITDFNSEISNLTNTVLEDVEINFDPSSGCKIEDVIGFKESEKGNSASIRISSLRPGENRSILIKLSKQDSIDQVAINGRISFKRAKNGSKGEKEIKGILRIANDEKGSRNVHTYSKILQMKGSESVQQSMESYKKGDKKQAIKKLDKHIKNLKSQNGYLKSEMLQQEIQILTDILYDLEKTNHTSSKGKTIIKSSKERARNIKKGK